jgi:hypothetical protein
MSDPRQAIEQFLKASRIPVLMEAGDDPLPIRADSFLLKERGGTVTIECWSETRNLVRRVRGVHFVKRGRVVLEVERFGVRTGTVTLIDMADPGNRDADRRGMRLKYREHFRLALKRQFPGWRIVELSTEPDLHHSLSPSYPRAFLRRGATGLAAIGAGDDSLAPEGVLSFGLLWLDHLRKRETRVGIEALVVFVPAGAAATTCHRIRYLNSNKARYRVFVHGPGGQEDPVEPSEYTNFETRLDVCRTALGEGGTLIANWVDRIQRLDGVERRDRPDGSVSLAVRGLEFARAAGEQLLFGIDRKHAAESDVHAEEIEELARGLARMRSAGAADQTNPLYMRHPEAWLESQVRGGIEQLDATLLPAPVYGQVPQFASGERSVIDLLAADREGRLAVIEVKAEQDIHLPLQALDYWMRVKWHLDRAEFSGKGYFQGLALGHRAPRLFLVAPALDFHPSNEVVLGYQSAEVEVERFGIGVEWRKELRVMFRMSADRLP